MAEYGTAVTRFALASLFAAALCAQQTPAPCLDRPEADRPYSRERLLNVVRDQTPARAAYLIRTCGIRTPWSEELNQALREAGAEDSVVLAVREKAPEPPPPPPKPVPAGPKVGDVKVNPKDGLRYAWVPPGTFRMGCSDGDTECDADEKPPHAVRITRGFWMGQTEVTVEAYKRYVRTTGGSMPPEPKFRDRALNAGWASDGLPMNVISWNDARDYCQWAGLRLPTEAEWEYAARAGSQAARYGDLDEVAWYADNSGDQRIDSRRIFDQESNQYSDRLVANANRPRPVGQKRPNNFQLYDMLGNVWEWVADWYGASEYANRSSREVTDPQGPPGGERRTLRGGSWYVYPRVVRLSGRFNLAPPSRNFFYGFRCIGDLPFP